MKEDDLTDKEMNIYKVVKNEIIKAFKKFDTGAYQTRYRYEDGMLMFGRFLVHEYRKQNMKTIKVKHLKAYADYMKDNGYSHSYITTNFSAIRYYYNQKTNGKVLIPSNKTLGIEARTRAERINVDRSMTHSDYVRYVELAKDKGLMDYVYLLKLSYLLGLRVHESAGIRKSDIKRCVNKKICDLEGSPTLKVKGKNGLIRYIPIEKTVNMGLLENILKHGKGKDDRLFVNGKEMHKVIKGFQKFIRNNRDPNSSYKVTAHSLRHSYAQREMQDRMKEKKSELQSKIEVARLLGHGRPGVTDIYIHSNNGRNNN